MLDSFLKVACANEEKVAEQTRLVEKMRQLPEDYLHKLASGEEKLAYGIGMMPGDDGTWLDRFKGTPLFEQALELEKQELQEQMAEKARWREEDAQRAQRNAGRDEICIQKKLLELQLAEAEAGGGEEEALAAEEEAAAAEGAPMEEPPAEEEVPAEEPPAEEAPAEEAPPAPPAEESKPKVDVKVASAMMLETLSKLAKESESPTIKERALAAKNKYDEKKAKRDAKGPIAYRAGAAVGRNYDKITGVGGGALGAGGGAALGHSLGGGKGALLGSALGAAGGYLTGRGVGRATQGLQAGMSHAYPNKTVEASAKLASALVEEFQQVVQDAYMQKTAAANVDVADCRMKLASAGFSLEEIDELEKQAIGALIGKAVQGVGRAAQRVGGSMGKARGATARLQQAAGDAPTGLLQRAGGKVEAAGAAANRAGGGMVQRSGTGTDRLQRAMAAEGAPAAAAAKAAPAAAPAAAKAAPAAAAKAAPSGPAVQMMPRPSQVTGPPPVPRSPFPPATAARPAAAAPAVAAPAARTQAVGQATKPSVGGFLTGAGRNIQGAYGAGGLAGGARMAKNIALDTARANPLATAGTALGAGYALG
jgi:hypothetical protein